MSNTQANWQAVEREIRDIQSDVDAIYECSTAYGERLEEIEDRIEQLVDVTNRNADCLRRMTEIMKDQTAALRELCNALTRPPQPSNAFSELFNELATKQRSASKPSKPKARKPKLHVVKNDEAPA